MSKIKYKNHKSFVFVVIRQKYCIGFFMHGTLSRYVWSTNSKLNLAALLNSGFIEITN